MSDQMPTRGDASALDDDFEWVNTWAGSMRPSAPAVPTTNQRATPVRSESKDRVHPQRDAHAGEDAAPTDRHARKPAPPVVAQAPDDHAATPADDDGFVTMSDVAPLPPAGRRAGRWTSLFRLVSRASTPEADAARELFVLDPADVPAPLADAQTSTQSSAGKPGAADQFAHDIAEIVARRDQLAAMPLGPRFADRPARSRTSDYVPILVGAVLAFTSLIVFGAAASFVSLR